MTREEEKKKFALLLRWSLDDRLMTQQELADTLGTSRGAIARYLKAETLPHPKRLGELANIFDWDLEGDWE